MRETLKEESSKLTIAYLARTTIPSRAANSLHIMNMCSALGDWGHSVELIIPTNKRIRKEEESDVSDVFTFYGLRKNFKIKKVSLLPFPGGLLLYLAMIVGWLKFKRPELVYTRDSHLAGLCCLLGVDVVYESHYFKVQRKLPYSFLQSVLIRSKRCVKVIAITKALADQLVIAGYDQRKIGVFPDAAKAPSAESKKINLSGKFVAGYLGHLYPGKGMEIIFPLAKRLPSVSFHVVGGKQEDIDTWKVKGLPQNLVLHGFVEPGKVSEYLYDFDCCLLPNQKKVKTSGGGIMDIGAVTSPLKMFDYMAHGKPVISSDLPVLKEVLTDEVALFCDPENVDSWIEALQRIKGDGDLRIAMGIAAKKLFEEKYSWKERARRILEFIHKDVSAA
ncbi:glycosyltransferase family 4 protein [Lewinella sp. W8]|uniref:glycosyltransferase family 4 protein n=1 Tax=Lewinella sp. W8 TaxID=2528208 RepID=UPI0010672BF2|nr:glycosyltransferase family 4 protein [Lewinella sp. W8]MTB53169.1 glycosyltransferase [Lewinella sp. W8]